MILITGATGRVGGATLKQLVNKGIPVRVLLRHPERAAALADLGVEPVIGDLAQPRSLEAALDGVTAALLVSPLDPHQVELQGNFIDAAKRVGRVHIVKISGTGNSTSTRRYEADAGMLRPKNIWRLPAYLLRTYVRRFSCRIFCGLPRTIRLSAEFVGALNQGKVAMIDVADIAAVATTALTTPGHAGKAYTPDGA